MKIVTRPSRALRARILMLRASVGVLAASILMVACSPGSSTRQAEEPRGPDPRDREVARHAGEAMVHAGQFDPTAGGTYVPCDGPRGQCWKPTENPTAPHAEQAAQHRAEAEAARKAAGWPRSAEEILCKGIPFAARTANPLDDVEVTEVRALTDTDPSAVTQKLRGARAALPSVTDPAAFQHRIDCHVEHVSARLAEYSGRDTCPLVTPGVIALVYATDDGTVLEMRAPDERSAAEVLRRVRAMARTR